MTLTRWQRNFIAALMGLVVPMVAASFIIGSFLVMEFRTTRIEHYVAAGILTMLVTVVLAGWIAISVRPSIKLKHEHNPGEYAFRTSALAGSLGCIYCLMLPVVPVVLVFLTYKFDEIHAVPVILLAIPAAIASHRIYYRLLHWLLKPRDWSPSDHAYLPVDEH